MNVQLSAAQLAEIETITMTKRDKLYRLASILRAATHQVFIFHGVEYMSLAERRMATHPYSAFALAAADAVLKDAGMTGDSVAEGVRFFQLSKDDLHAFSCDCGGHMTNEQMASRVEAIAARA